MMRKLLCEIIESCEDCDHWDIVYGTHRAFCDITNETLLDLEKIHEKCPLPNVPCEWRDVKEKYYELIMAVATKYPGESRHETALRYIKVAETNKGDPGKSGDEKREEE